MKRQILATLIMAMLPCLGQAQSRDYSRGHGYAFFGAGGQTNGGADIHLGGGVESFFDRNVGVGVEGGYLAKVGKPWYDGLTFSPNVVARFPARNSMAKAEPFVTGGYTLFYQQETKYRLNPAFTFSTYYPFRFKSGVNFGTGFNWWFKDRVGLRFDIRDYIRFGPWETAHIAVAHIGLTFR